MGLVELITKMFGNKAQKDMRAIMPYVDKVKAVYEEIDRLSNDGLRARSAALMQLIQERVADKKSRIAKLKANIEDLEIDKREKVYNEIDHIEKDIKSTYEDVLRYYRLENGCYYIDGKDARLIVLNPNYYYEDGEYVHYSMANYYDKSRDHVPPEQLAWLKDTIRSSETPCILLSHQSFERPDGVKNRDAVLDILREANTRRKNSVVMCINGHSHKDYMRMMDGICFWEVNSASFEVLEHRHNHFPQELYILWKHQNL